MSEAGKRRKLTPLECTAYHEAGHAVISFALGRPVKRVSIIPDEAEGSLGHCAHGVWPKSRRPDFNNDDRTRAFVENEIFILLAGSAAEAKARGRHNHVGARSDHANTVDLALSVYHSTDEARPVARRRCPPARRSCRGRSPGFLLVESPYARTMTG
jgi:ATP-dependent Zn protease